MVAEYKGELQKDGHYLVKVYGKDRETLLSTYQTNAEGEKDGVETVYIKGTTEIKKTTNWKNGKKDGLEVEKRSGILSLFGWAKKETVWKDGKKSEETFYKKPDRSYTTKLHKIKKYEEGKHISTINYKYKTIWGAREILERYTPLNVSLKRETYVVGKQTRIWYPVRLNGEHYEMNEPRGVQIATENGKIKHITIRFTSAYKRATGLLYSMEFKDGKEYNGFCDVRGMVYGYNQGTMLYGDIEPAKKQRVAEKGTPQKLDEMRQKITSKSQTETEDNTVAGANLNLRHCSDEVLASCFNANKAALEKKRKLGELPEEDINSRIEMMCKLYYFARNSETKAQLLQGLYEVRKGGLSSYENCGRAEAIKKALVANPELKEDRNLVALSKIDTLIKQPTKNIKKQITR